MRSGLYCLTKGIRVNGGGTLQSEVLGTATEGGVTIVVLDGNFDVAGNATVKLKAPSPDCNANPDAYNLTCPPAIPGMLIYLPPGNTGRVSVAGTSYSEYTGTIYAPDGFIDVGGTSSSISEVGAQMIANSILVHGDTNINIHYDSSTTYNYPARPPAALISARPPSWSTAIPISTSITTAAPPTITRHASPAALILLARHP